MSDDVCEIITDKDGFTYEEAFNRAMEYTRKNKKEAFFNFIVDNKEKHIDKIYLGECNMISAEIPYPSEEFDGDFHTHPQRYLCRPSRRDIISGIGYYNVIGCPYTKRKDKVLEFDLRLGDNKYKKQYQDALEFECKEMFED